MSVHEGSFSFSAPPMARRSSKWTLVVVTRLRRETFRFSELRRSITGISQKVLSRTLRDLERDGYVERTVYATIPPRVEYRLSQLGRDLLDMADAWERFMRDHREAVETARQRFDADEAPAAIRRPPEIR